MIPAAPRRRFSWEKRERLFAAALLAPCFVFAALFAFIPILASVRLSLHRMILGLPALGQPFVGLENYRTLLVDPVARAALRNTLLFVGISTSFEVLFGLGVALVIHRRFRGRGLVRAWKPGFRSAGDIRAQGSEMCAHAHGQLLNLTDREISPGTAHPQATFLRS